MFIFGHVGLTAGLIYLISKKWNSSIDYRYIILGSLLSDIIDKPLGNILLFNVLNNGRIIGHSVVFALALALIGVYKRNILYIAYGVFMHLILDSMWLNPATLFWPSLGNFHIMNLSFSEFSTAFFQPYNLLGEIMGFVSLALLALRHKLYRVSNLRSLAITGILKSSNSTTTASKQ